MRRLFVFIAALITLGFLAGVVWAGQVSISGTHTKAEIKATCDSVGGVYSDDPNGAYSCINTCGDGDTCGVACNKSGKCTGDCPSCGRPLPVLGGAAPLVRTLKNSVRPSKQ